MQVKSYITILVQTSQHDSIPSLSSGVTVSTSV